LEFFSFVWIHDSSIQSRSDVVETLGNADGSRCGVEKSVQRCRLPWINLCSKHIRVVVEVFDRHLGGSKEATAAAPSLTRHVVLEIFFKKCLLFRKPEHIFPKLGSSSFFICIFGRVGQSFILVKIEFDGFSSVGRSVFVLNVVGVMVFTLEGVCISAAEGIDSHSE